MKILDAIAAGMSVEEYKAELVKEGFNLEEEYQEGANGFKFQSLNGLEVLSRCLNYDSWKHFKEVHALREEVDLEHCILLLDSYIQDEKGETLFRIYFSEENKDASADVLAGMVELYWQAETGVTYD